MEIKFLKATELPPESVRYFADQDDLSIEASAVGPIIHYRSYFKNGSFHGYSSQYVTREDIQLLREYRAKKGLPPIRVAEGQWR